MKFLQSLANIFLVEFPMGIVAGLWNRAVVCRIGVIGRSYGWYIAVKFVLVISVVANYLGNGHLVLAVAKLFDCNRESVRLGKLWVGGANVVGSTRFHAAVVCVGCWDVSCF